MQAPEAKRQTQDIFVPPGTDLCMLPSSCMYSSPCRTSFAMVAIKSSSIPSGNLQHILGGYPSKEELPGASHHGTKTRCQGLPLNEKHSPGLDNLCKGATRNPWHDQPQVVPVHKGAEKWQDVVVPVLPHHRGFLRQLVLHSACQP